MRSVHTKDTALYAKASESTMATTLHPHDLPIKLAPERAWRTYLGGGLLDSFHGILGEGDQHFPEEWIMSVVAARNAGRENIVEGMSRLADNPEITLKSLVEAKPKDLLGEKHVARFGSTPGVLVKLLDSFERLAIQVHPDRVQAKKLFNSDYGKTECWHILGGRNVGGETPCVYLGFKEGITRARWKDLFDRQDIRGMLDAMHRFDVEKGETILIEGGVPHAIGAGCFLVEIQEPTDYTIRIERTTPSGFAVADMMCHQGLGFEVMFDCFAYEGMSREQARSRWFIQPKTVREERGGTVVSLLTHERCPYFRLDLVTVNSTLEFAAAPVFSGIYALDGKGQLRAGDRQFPLERGAQYFLPATLPDIAMRNESDDPLVVLRFFGPR